MKISPNIFMKIDDFKGLYEDFFGIEKLRKQNEEINEELKKMKPTAVLNNKDIPSIDVEEFSKDLDEWNKKLIDEAKKDYGMDSLEERQSAVQAVEHSKEDKDEFMKKIFEKIDELYITDDSKKLLKKIVEYMRKYQEKLENEYIQFNLILLAESRKIVASAAMIIYEAGKYFNYLVPGEIQAASFYNIEKVETIDTIYDKHSVAILQDFAGFDSKADSFKKQFVYNVEEKIRDSHISTILSTKTINELDEFFFQSENLKEKYFDFEIIEQKPDVQDVVEAIKDKVGTSYEIKDELEIKLVDYVAATYKTSKLSFSEYIDDLSKKIIFEKDIPIPEVEKSLDEIFAELDELVGLHEVKKVLRDLVSLKELKNKSSDLKINDVNLHMVFLGNPGTGKTTVARLVAQILYNLKYIEQNKLIEVSSKDLVAEYVGQTAPKTNAVIQRALGGVLFIDEAYSLASGNGFGSSFNEEAIATLIQGMENYRDNLVVIFAGYTKEMQAFLNANSGIVSRIGYTLNFADYTNDELLQIFEQMMNKSGFVVTPEALEEVKRVTEEYRDTPNFGNARFIRNVYEKSVIKHSNNVKGKKRKDIIKTITKDDISTENLLKM